MKLQLSNFTWNHRKKNVVSIRTQILSLTNMKPRDKDDFSSLKYKLYALLKDETAWQTQLPIMFCWGEDVASF